MLLSLFFTAPMLALVWLTALVIALTVHEFSHAIVGKWRGDDTAEKFGRLSLNPLAHIDPLGFLMLVSIGFGWAKPVPFNPQNLRHPLKDGLMIALAGPAANLVMAVVAAGVFAAGVVVDGVTPSIAFVTVLSSGILGSAKTELSTLRGASGVAT